jgi:hypothetical protein
MPLADQKSDLVRFTTPCRWLACPCRWLACPCRWLAYGLLAIQIGCWVTLLVWNFLDPRLEAWRLPEAWRAMEIWRSLDGETSGSAGELATLDPGVGRILDFLIGAAVVTGVGLLTAVLWAPAPFRSVRSIGWLVVLVAAWLSIISNWSHISWWGHRYRAQSALVLLDQIAGELQESWPRHDGESPLFGPYMAYPAGQPSTLILLKPAATGDPQRWLSAIDRAESDGVLRFELSDGYQTFWLEQHDAALMPPPSFTNGIGSQYQVENWIRLNPRWRLARYR